VPSDAGQLDQAPRASEDAKAVSLGGEPGGHLSFIWHHGGFTYLASLHAWDPPRDTLALLTRLMAHLTHG